MKNFFKNCAPWVPVAGLFLMPLVILKSGHGYKPWVIVASDIVNIILGFIGLALVISLDK